MMVFLLSVAFAVIFHVSVDSSDADAGIEAHRVTGGDGARGRATGTARLGGVASNPNIDALSFRHWIKLTLRSSWVGQAKIYNHLKQARRRRISSCVVPCIEVEGQQ
jgi:hypothetical protein